MSRVIAINGSPRKNGNTAILLQKALDGAASVGAETEIVHLVDLNYKGCTSCFACKRKGAQLAGFCAMRDELSPTIEKALSGDAIICGSPIYLGDVSSLTRAFIERIGFSSVSYDRGHNSTFSGKINCAFFYTMNVPRPIHLFYHYVYLLNTGNLRRFNGKVQQLVSTDTWQFDDYSKYNASMFNEDKKRKRRETQFPKDCKKAFEIGRGIV